MLSFPQFDYLFLLIYSVPIYCHFLKGVIKSVKEINKKKIIINSLSARIGQLNTVYFVH